jgi:hypothetical protein
MQHDNAFMKFIYFFTEFSLRQKREAIENALKAG